MRVFRCSSKRVSGRLALWCALLGFAAAGPVQAQLWKVELAFHVHCFSGVAEAEAQRLEYWSEALARGNPDPDCVARQPIAPPVLLKWVTLQEDDESEMAVVRLEIDPGDRAVIDSAMKAWLRQVIAITLQNRIVATVFLTGTTHDDRIPVHIQDKEGAAALLSDLRTLLGKPR